MPPTPRRGVVFDLDDTLVDTSLLRGERERRAWRDAVRSLHRTSVFIGIHELVSELAARSIPWAVATTSVSFYAEAVLRHHSLGAPPLVAFHDAPRKPNPAPILLALQKLALGPDDVVGLGDSGDDLLAYRAAGITAVGAGWSPALARADWDLVARSPAEVLGLLRL